jgi:hypothetical protein
MNSSSSRPKFSSPLDECMRRRREESLRVLDPLFYIKRKGSRSSRVFPVRREEGSVTKDKKPNFV